jgi:peptide/nickel transport system permease protein
MAIALDSDATPHMPADVRTLSLNQLMLRRFMRHKLAVVGVVMFLTIALGAIFAPLLTAYDPAEQDLFAIAQPPSSQHVLGADELGRDLFARLLYGGRVSLTVGILSALIATAIGVAVGAIAGYYGGWVDNALMRLVDVLLAFPALFLLLILFAIIRPSLAIVILFLGLFGWLYLARIIRGEFLALREKEFVEASRALGAANRRMILRHLLPNVIASIIVATTLEVAYAMLAEGTLSFLGYGVPASTPSWGNMLNAAQSYYLQAPIMTIAPGLALTLTVLSINFIGDGLRDALDPRS